MAVNAETQRDQALAWCTCVVYSVCRQFLGAATVTTKNTEKTAVLSLRIPAALKTKLEAQAA
ncbi:hypothetical protein ACNKW8_004811, partial [Salmonella enterica]